MRFGDRLQRPPHGPLRYACRHGEEARRSFTHVSGLVRSFFATLKAGTGLALVFHGWELVGSEAVAAGYFYGSAIPDKHRLPYPAPVCGCETAAQADTFADEPGDEGGYFRWALREETQIKDTGWRRQSPAENQFAEIAVERDDYPILRMSQAQHLLIGYSRRQFRDRDHVVAELPQAPHARQWNILVGEELQPALPPMT